DTETTEIYTLSLHDALPICITISQTNGRIFSDLTNLELNDDSSSESHPNEYNDDTNVLLYGLNKVQELISKQFQSAEDLDEPVRSEEHTSELQSRRDLVCRL